METGKWKIIETPSDGDCFFHAFLIDTGIKTNPKELRAIVANVLEKNNDLYQDLLLEWRDLGVISKNTKLSPKQVADIIRNTKEWATSTIIHIISVLFKIKIIVHEKINGKLFAESFPSEWKNTGIIPKKSINILRIGNHFEALKYVKNSNNKTNSLENDDNGQGDIVLSQFMPRSEALLPALGEKNCVFFSFAVIGMIFYSLTF
jgi:predicted transcriptional regulator